MNIAFIDGQNLHKGTQEQNWGINFHRFRQYLKDKYKVREAYYFLGILTEECEGLYRNLQKAGFIVIFREHSTHLQSKKKGNVDTDIVFEMMKSFIEESQEKKIVLVSGDGDYKKVVDYLIKKERFLKILFPYQGKASSLYKSIGNKFRVDLSRSDIRSKIEYKYKKEEGG